MALILKRKKSATTTPTDDKARTVGAEGTPENFLAAPELPSDGEARTATAPKKLVIKGKKPKGSPGKALETPEMEGEASVKAPEQTAITPKAPNKAARTGKCTFCGYERTDPCHGSKEWRGSTAADGTKLECADKRLVKRLRAEGKDQFGQPLNEQRERDAKDDCVSGLHSWVDAVGKLHPTVECKFCGEMYGEPT